MVVKILAIVLVPLVAIALIAILALNSAGDRISDAMMKHELSATEYALEMCLHPYCSRYDLQSTTGGSR